jgi:hypothetical protein
MRLSGAVVAFALSAAAGVSHAGGSAVDSSKVIQAALHQVEQQQQPEQQQLTKPSKYGHGVKPGPRELHSVRAAAADAYKKVPKLRLKARENRKSFENMLRGLAVSKEDETLAMIKGAVKPAPMPVAKRRTLKAQSQMQQLKQPLAMQGQPPKEKAEVVEDEHHMQQHEQEQHQPERKLDENYNQAYKQYNQQYSQNYNGNANYNAYSYNGNANAYNYNNAGGNNQQQQYNGNQQNNNANGAQGGYYSYGGEYDWNQAMEEQDFGFDISDYAIKYTGCHRVETYNDNVAQNENINSVLGSQSYATFRLCPADECYENNVWGCSSNYGEYVVAMEDFLGGLLGYNEERVYGYCEYCAECANVESYKDWANQVKMQKAYTVEHAESLFENYYQNLITKEQEEAQYVQSQSYSSSSNTKSNWWNWGSYGNKNSNSNNYKSQNYNGEEQQNANGQTYMQDMDEDEAKAYAMVKYYNKVKNNQYQYGANAAYGYGNGNSGNNKNSNSNYKGGYYANGQYNPNNGYYGGNNNAYMQQSMASQYDAYNQNMWQFSSGNQNYNNLYTQDSNYQHKQQYQSWQSMGQFATYGPYMVYPGYFDDDGAFVSGYGYFNAYGKFVSLEETEYRNNNDDEEAEENSGASWDYDYEIYGDMPEGWVDIMGMDPDEVESCQMNYAGNCYTQYSTCMYLLYDEAQTTQQEYNEFIANQISTYTSQGISYEDMWEEMEVNWQSYQENAASSQTVQKNSQQTHDRQKEIEQLMMCQQVNYNPYKWAGYESSGTYNNAQTQQIYETENSYSNQQVNAEMYQYNMYIESQIEACAGDADCEEALEYQREQNTEYQTWVKENQNHQWKDYQDASLGYYIGASCDAGSGSLGLAVYRDEDCSVEDETYTVERILGYDPMDFIDDLVPHECIKCGLDVSKFLACLFVRWSIRASIFFTNC